MLPLAFISRIKNQFKDADDFLNAIEKPYHTSVRLHPLKGENLGLPVAEKIPWCDGAFYLKERPSFTMDPLFHAGAYYVQESSSMFIWHVLDQIFTSRDIRILDACAAPGGKSTLIASWLNGNGLLVSNEVIKSRVSVLLENICKWGYNNTWVTNTDLHVLGGLEGFFDAVVVDAPCSGEGLFRRDPDSTKEWSESNCELCSGRQKKIVADILPAIRVGGYLVYSTCTFNPSENEENIKWLTSHFPLEVVTINSIAFPEVISTGEGAKAFYPHHVKGEGFYCCVLQKTDEITVPDVIRRKKLSLIPMKKLSIAEDFLSSPERFYYFTKDENVHAIPSGMENDFEVVSSVTKIQGGYLTLGTQKGKDFIPHHSLAMSIHVSPDMPAIQLNKPDSLHYLARKPFSIQGLHPGWYLLKYQSRSLGFIKQVQGRFNNYYPTEWRIRMELPPTC